MQKKRDWIVYGLTGVVALLISTLGLYNNYGDSPGQLAEELGLFFEFRIPIYYISLGALGVWAVAFHYVSKELDKRKAEAEEVQHALNDELRQTIMINREYYRYRQKDVLKDYFSTYLKLHPNVQGIQLLQYQEKHLRNKVTIRIEHEFGVAYDRVNLNAMGQAYYDLDPKLLSDFRKAKRALEVDHSVPMTRFVLQQGLHLAEKDHQFVEEDAIAYAFLDLGIRLLEDKLDAEYDFSEIIHADDHITLDSLKRTGILRAILLETGLFTFMYKKNGEKKDRLYMGRVIKDDQGLKYLYLVIFDSSILGVPHYDREVIRVEREISEKIVKLLSIQQNTA